MQVLPAVAEPVLRFNHHIVNGTNNNETEKASYLEAFSIIKTICLTLSRCSSWLHLFYHCFFTQRSFAAQVNQYWCRNKDG